MIQIILLSGAVSLAMYTSAAAFTFAAFLFISSDSNDVEDLIR